MPLSTTGPLFIFVYPSCILIADLKIDSFSQTPPKFQQNILPETVHNGRNKATGLTRISFLFASNGMPVCQNYLVHKWLTGKIFCRFSSRKTNCKKQQQKPLILSLLTDQLKQSSNVCPEYCVAVCILQL